MEYAAIAAISLGFRLLLCLSLRIADGLGEHLAQLSLGLRRFLRKGFLPLCHHYDMGMPEAKLNPRGTLKGPAIECRTLPEHQKIVLFLVSGDHGLTFGAGLFRPIGRQLLADFLETGLQRRRWRKHLHLVGLKLFEIPLRLLFRELPAAFFGDRRRLQDRILGRLVERVKSRLVHEGYVLRNPGLRIIEVRYGFLGLAVVAGRT